MQNEKCKMRNAKFCPLHFEICNWTESGFSLLELLVVLLLLALSSALVLPAIDKGLKERELKQSALELAAVARELRSRAVYQNTLQSLVLNPSENSYQTLQGEKVLIPTDVRLVDIVGGEPLGDGLRRFLFFPNGSTLGGDIAISGPVGSSYIIRLDPLLGKVTVIRGERK